MVPGAHAPYPLVVASSERSINRAAWADVIRELMTAHTRGKKEPFARRLGINSRSVSRWLDQEVDVSEESVRLVARTFDVPAVSLLVRVGYYQQADLHQPHQPSAEEFDADPALKVIEDSDQPPHVKARMRERLYELRRQRTAAEVDEVRFWLDRAGEG